MCSSAVGSCPPARMSMDVAGASGALLLCTSRAKADTSSAVSLRCMCRWGAEPRAADRWPEDDAPAERWAAAPDEHDHAPGLCQLLPYTQPAGREASGHVHHAGCRQCKCWCPAASCSGALLSYLCLYLHTHTIGYSERDSPPMQTMCSTRCWQTPHSACRQMMGAAVTCRLPQQPMEAERLRAAGNTLRGILPRTSFQESNERQVMCLPALQPV